MGLLHDGEGAAHTDCGHSLSGIAGCLWLSLPVNPQPQSPALMVAGRYV